MRTREITAFTRDIGQLLQAGLPLVESLKRFQQSAPKTVWKTFAGSLRGQLEEGKPLSASLMTYPALFDPLYVGMVRAGEVSGSLPDTLLRLADLAEKRQELRGRITSALLYPSVILLLGVVTVFVLVSFVAPVFLSVFDDAGQALPWPTQLLLRSAHLVRHRWWIVVPGIAGAIVTLVRYVRTENGRRLYHRLLLRCPLIGQLVLKNEIVRFTYTLSALLRSDVPMLSALSTVAGTQGNTTFAEHVSEMVRHVRDGSSLSRSLEKHPLIPSLVAGAAAVGEETGKLSESLQRVSSQCEADMERHLNVFATLLEPLLIVAVGGVIGFVVVAMVLPVFELGSAIQM
jgi:type II secretory pathway component PulF